jgi:hypothetical protein
MIRLNELHVKAGTARQQQYAGKQRRIVNQHNTETVNRYTLTDILKEKSEHLWISGGERMGLGEGIYRLGSLLHVKLYIKSLRRKTHFFSL